MSSTVPPTDEKGRWERGTSPWHKDVFPDKLKDQAPEQTVSPRNGWYELDWCKNRIGFVPDGIMFNCKEKYGL